MLRDWSTGKFPRYTHPPAPSSAAPSAGAEWADLYAADAAILESAQTRKEMRKGAGLVKLVPGAVETRRAVLDASWNDVAGDDGEEAREDRPAAHVSLDDDEEDSAVESLLGSEDEDEEDDVEDGEDEDVEDGEAPQGPLSGKRKRQGKAASTPASKKVAFAADPKGSKQARASAAKKPAAKKSAPTSAKTKGAKVMKDAIAKAKQVTTQGGDQAYDFGRFF